MSWVAVTAELLMGEQGSAAARAGKRGKRSKAACGVAGAGLLPLCRDEGLQGAAAGLARTVWWVSRVG